MAVTPNSIITPQTIITGRCRLTAANSNAYDAPGANVVQLLPAQANGARITRVQAIPGATVAACDVQAYAYDGVNYRLIKVVAMAAQTLGASGTAAVIPTDFGFSDANPLILSSTEQLVLGISVAQTVHGRCEGGAY